MKRQPIQPEPGDHWVFADGMAWFCSASGYPRLWMPIETYERLIAELERRQQL